MQEASASFAEWERLMKGLGSGAVTTDNPFTEVMGLVTQMYKQTAIAKVIGDQVVLEYVLFYPCPCNYSIQYTHKEYMC